MTHMTQDAVDAHMAKMESYKKPVDKTEHEADEGLESNLQRKCENWLDERYFPYIHDRSRGKNKKGKILDLHIYLEKGRHVVIELKAKGNKMSPEQTETFRRIMYLGHEIHECRSFKRFLEIMENVQGVDPYLQTR